MKAINRLGSPRQRLGVLTALLAIGLGLTAALAYQSARAARLHRETAVQTLQDYADFAAYILASRVYRVIGQSVAETFRDVPAEGAIAAFAGGNIPPWFGDRSCHDGGVLSDRYYFEVNLETGVLRSGGAVIPAALADWIVDTTAALAPQAWNRALGFQAVYKTIESSRQSIVVRAIKAPDGTTTGVRGFSTCFADSESSVFSDVMRDERLLPPALVGEVNNDSLFSLIVADRVGFVVYRSPVQYVSEYTGSTSIWDEMGGVFVDVTLRSDVADDLVIGGVPKSNLPIAAGLLVLNGLLVFSAMLQFKREYELVGLRSRFISNVSHELRTPLAQILLFAELLKLDKLRTQEERSRSCRSSIRKRGG